MRSDSRWTSMVVAGALTLVGCASGVVPDVPPTVSLTFDRQAVISELAHPTTSDWSDNRLTSPSVDALRAQPVEAAYRTELEATSRRIQAVGNSYNASSTGFGAASATGKISNAPAYSFWTKEAYWLTENGWLLKRNMTTGVNSAYQLTTTDTFINTALTISNDGLRAYAVSQQGRFYAVNTQTGVQLVGSPFAMGGTHAKVPTSCAPHLDPLASRDDGQIETLYAVTATGTLHRFYVNAPHAAASNTWTLAHPQTYALPVNNAAPYTELFRANPVVFGGRLVVGTWRSNSSNAALDHGNLIYYNTGLSGIPASATTTTTGSTIRSVTVGAPIWASAAIEFDAATFTPALAFVPTGYVISMVDLATGQQAQTVPLLVNQNASDGPASGALANYPYGSGGVSTVNKQPVNNGALSIANSLTLGSVLNGSWRDLNEFYGCKAYDSDDNIPIWAYAKFNIANSDVVVSGSTRAIIDAKLSLRCNSASNANGSQNPSPVRAFRVSNNYSNGGAWDSQNMTPSNRPAFEDGAAFSFNTLNAHKSVELTNFGNSFSKNQTYTASAKGLVATANQDYSFGVTNEDLYYVNQANNNGQPFKTSAPRFDGGTAPKLVLTLSAQGLATPTMTTPVTIDSWNHRIYSLNTNALYVASYASATGDVAATPYDGLYFTERATTFSDPALTYFALTALGQSSSSGPVTASQFVANLTAPLFTGSHVYVIDYHPTTNVASVNDFTVSAGTNLPGFSASYPLTTNASDAKKGATYMSYDPVGAKLFVGTNDTTAGNNGRAWVLTL